MTKQQTQPKKEEEFTKDSFFWTDIAQATERLSSSCVIYDDYPVFISEVYPGDDGAPRGNISVCGVQGGRTLRKRLDSTYFHKFRKLPEIGWMNFHTRNNTPASYLSRVTQTSRTHGLSRNNVLVTTPSFVDEKYAVQMGRAINFDHCWADEGFAAMHKKEYPSLDAILKNIKPGSAIAFSRKNCVLQDRDGVLWVYHHLDRVGIISGESLFLFKKFFFLREEISEEEAFTLNVIREF